MIDWDKPLRLVGSKRQVYRVDGSKWGGMICVGPDNRWGSGGVWFHPDGTTIDPPPGWEVVENFDPLAELLAGVEEVETPQQRKMREALQDQARDNPLFGAFG